MLKTKTITTDKATVLVVEVSEVTRNVVLFGDDEIGYYADGINKYTKLPKGNWQLLGRLPEMTQEQADPLVEKAKDFVTGEMHYLDYEDETNLVRKATQALRSLLQANEVYFENPLGKRPDATCFETTGAYIHMVDVWQTAQSKVWDKERCYLFIKVD